MRTTSLAPLLLISTSVALAAPFARTQVLPGSALQEFRSVDGSGNNLGAPDWGRAGIPLLRLTSIGYADGVSAPGGAARPGAREISNWICSQELSVPSSVNASAMLWQWGQFVDHDIDLTGAADPPEPFFIPVPAGDPYFDPGGGGGQSIFLFRSLHQTQAGARQQINEITAFLDGSAVYGCDPIRAATLRTLDGTGRLATSAMRLPPFNTAGLPNAQPPGTNAAEFHLAGDIRANEQVGLTSLHTLFVREHNRLTGKIRRIRPRLTGDQIYLYARAIVGAEIQAITYREYLPVLLGPGALPPYSGYDPAVNPGIANFFSTCAYRFGHTMLGARLLRLGKGNRPVWSGHLDLADAFFRPDHLASRRDGGIEAILRGLVACPAEEVDTRVVGAVRNFLFGPPGAGGFDLAALNIQRGRDHGLPDYNQARADFGLPPAASLAELTPDPELRQALANLYGSVDELDAWVGGLLERPAPGAMLGPLFHRALVDQFTRLRDGDRFWYENYLPPELARYVESQTLARIIRQNTRIEYDIPDDLFHATGAGLLSGPDPPSSRGAGAVPPADGARAAEPPGSRDWQTIFERFVRGFRWAPRVPDKPPAGD